MVVKWDEEATDETDCAHRKNGYQNRGNFEILKEMVKS